MASRLNPPNRQSHIYNSIQLIRDIRYVGVTRLLGVKVEIHQLPTLPTSLLRTSSPSSGGPLAPSGSLNQEYTNFPFVYIYLYLVGLYYFNWKLPVSYGHLFHLGYNSESLNYIYHNFLNFSWLWTNHENYYIVLPYPCDRKTICNKFSFRYNKHWDLVRLLFRWSHETTMRSRKLRVKNVYWQA